MLALEWWTKIGEDSQCIPSANILKNSIAASVSTNSLVNAVLFTIAYSQTMRSNSSIDDIQL